MIVTVVDDVTDADVVTEKGCETVAPAGTRTVAGTDATAGFELVRPIETPPAGAAELAVTVPVTVVPRVTIVGTFTR